METTFHENVKVLVMDGLTNEIQCPHAFAKAVTINVYSVESRRLANPSSNRLLIYAPSHVHVWLKYHPLWQASNKPNKIQLPTYCYKFNEFWPSVGHPHHQQPGFLNVQTLPRPGHHANIFLHLWIVENSSVQYIPTCLFYSSIKYSVYSNNLDEN